MKVLHLADIHARDRDIGEIEKCLNYIIEVAKAEQPDIIVNAGDTFDSQNIKMDSLSAKMIFKIFKELADIAPVVTIIGTPSHDSDTVEVLEYIEARYPIHVSTVPEQLYLCEGAVAADVKKPQCHLEAPIEAVISMIPAPTKQHFQTNSGIQDSNIEIAAEMSKVFMGMATKAAAYPDAVHIMVGHWQVDGAMISETQTLLGADISISNDQMSQANADIVLLGHIHMNQKTGHNVFYSGSITGLTWGETEAKGFYLHDIITDNPGSSTKKKCLINSRFIKTPSKKLIKLSEDLTIENAIDTVNDERAPVFQDEIAEAHLKIEYKVYQDEAVKLDVNDIKNFYLEQGAATVKIILVRVPRDNVRSQTILKLETLKEKLIEMARLRAETVPERILDKADTLEAVASEKIIAGI